MTTDRFGRIWDLPATELCEVCGQPDNCGDCNHERLSTDDVTQLGGKEPPYVVVYAAHERNEQWATVHGPFATQEDADKVCYKMAREELYLLYEHEPEADAIYNEEQSLERDRIKALSDDEALTEFNDGEFGTFHTAVINAWKEEA